MVVVNVKTALKVSTATGAGLFAILVAVPTLTFAFDPPDTGSNRSPTSASKTKASAPAKLFRSPHLAVDGPAKTVSGISTQTALLFVRKGDLLVQNGEMRGAAQAYLSAALAEPRDPMPRLAAGIALSEIGQGRAAVMQFRRASALAEDDVVAAFLLQNALSEQGDTQEAQVIYQDVYRRFATPGKAGLDTAGSIARLQAARVKWGDSSIINLLLGDAFQLAEDFPRADAAYQTAIHLNPIWCKPRVNLGISLLAQNKTDLAIRTFESALRLEPRNTQARLWKGESEISSGRNEAALITLEPVAAMSRVAPQAAVQAMNGLGRAFANTHRYDKAIATLKRAQKVAPDDPTTPAILGDVRMQQGDANAATQAYQTALNLTRTGGLFSTRSGLLRSLAEAQLSAGRPQDALATVEGALQDDKAGAALWHRLAARAYGSLKQSDKAEEAFADALAAENGPYPLDTLRAMDAARAIPAIKARFEQDLADTNTLATPLFQALGALANLARYENEIDREVVLRKRLIAARSKPSGWDWFLLAEVYDQKLLQPVAARDAYLKALQAAGLSDAATRFARQRTKLLTEPVAHPN